MRNRHFTKKEKKRKEKKRKERTSLEKSQMDKFNPSQARLSNH